MELLTYPGNPIPVPFRVEIDESGLFHSSWVHNSHILKMTVNPNLNKASLKGAGVSCPMLCAKKIRGRLSQFFKEPPC